MQAEVRAVADQARVLVEDFAISTARLFVDLGQAVALPVQVDAEQLVAA